MIQKHLLNLNPARTAGMLSGARRVAMLLVTLLLTMTAQKAWADTWPEYITDVVLVGGTESEAQSAKSGYSGYTWCSKSLNDGTSGDVIYIGYKTGNSANTNGGYITDFIVVDAVDHNPPSTISCNGHTYYLCPADGADYFANSNHGNLTSHASQGWNIYLYYTKEHFSDKRAVSSIAINDTKSGAIDCYKKDGTLIEENISLNRGVNNTPYVYMHIYTSTKVNRPYPEPTTISGLTYDGSPHQLIPSNYDSDYSGDVYFRLGTTGSYTSNVNSITATNAGTYTIYYYSGESYYGNSSVDYAHTISATIAKSPNSGVTVSCADVVDGNAPAPQLSGNLSTGTVTYKYCTTQNGTYTTTVPTDFGQYWVKATIASDDNCNAYTTAAASFYILSDANDLWNIKGGANGTQAHPIIISTPSQLDLLAKRVNGTNGYTANTYSGKYFELGDNITYDGTENNYTPIGGNGNHEFAGHFDGKGYTVSGININKNQESYKGLFGKIGSSAEVKNLTLDNTQIVGRDYCGGIAGNIYMGTISNCHVTSRVTIHGSYNYSRYHGGIVGNNNTSSVIGCTSAATVSCQSSNSNMDEYGGIAGRNTSGTIQNCLVYGCSINGTSRVGAVVGNYVSGTLTNNHYSGVTLNGSEALLNAGVGYGSQDGTRYICAIIPYEGVTLSIPSGSATTEYPYNGLKIYPTGMSYNGRYYNYIADADANISGDVTFTATYTGSLPEAYALSGFGYISQADATDVPTDWAATDGSATCTLCTDVAMKYYIAPTFTITRLIINMPKTGTQEVTIPTGVLVKVYDDGGADGNYSDNCSGTLVLTAPTGYVLQLSGSITMDTWDYLTVYDGRFDGDTKLLDAVSSIHNNTETAITTVTSSGQIMKLYFKSDYSDNYAGLDLTVTLISTNTEFGITVNNATGGTVAASVGGNAAATAKVNDVVTLTATPESGYMLSGISVTDGSSNAVAVAWDGPFFNTATFKMPAGDVTVTPTFTNAKTAADGLYVNMPATDTKTLTIPAGVQSFKVYDDGGADGKYSNNCSGTLILTAPEGYVLQLSGNITMHTWDKLTVYDGSDNTASKLLDAVSSTSNGTQTAITTVTSTGQSMTLFFRSYYYDTYAGLDLTVTLISTNTEFGINGLGTTTGGTIAATVSGTSASTAKMNDVVTLTATPESGYMLSGISVTDAYSNAVAVVWDGSFSNTATFKMPAGDVTVTPTFANTLTADNGLYINMPTTDAKTVTIPEGVQSFKVYDDGGADGNYSDNCDGTLVLTAPTGYVLQLSGSITMDTWDHLTVYDGSEANGEKKLLDAVSSPSHGTETAITTVTSTGQSMTLYFYSSVYYNYAGIDLTVTVLKTLELADNADNTTAISGNNGQTITALTLAGRTIYRDGDWNTLCLPFALTAEQIAASPLADATIKELNGTTSGLNGSTLTLNFTTAYDPTDAPTGSIVAGKPYIVKWNPGAGPYFISGAIYDDGNSVVSGEGPAKLVDGDTGTKYFMNANPWVEFHYASAITPKGYALWTADDAADGSRNPTSWTIKAKVNSGDTWTTLVTVDNSAGDKLPKAINTRTVFVLDNSTAYKYFRFEAVQNSNGFQLAELQFYTDQPINITNPVFNNVTIDATAPTEVTSTDGNVKFVGQYSPFSIGDTSTGTYDGDINEILYVASGNKIGYSKSARTLKSCRAHFWVQPNGTSAGARTINLDFGDGETTSITLVNADRENDASGIYTLDGRKLSDVPTQKGVYIVNGKKIVVK